VTISCALRDRTVGILRIIIGVHGSGPRKRSERLEKSAAESMLQPHGMKILDIRAPATKSRRRLARYKDAGRSLRTAERERCPRAGARHLRSRAASGQRPAGITTGLRVDRWTGTGGDGQPPSLATSQEARLEPNGGVGSLPQEPRWNAGRRSALR
jgi:hypothetical protein